MNCISTAPTAPQNVEVYAINSTAIHVKWAPPLHPNGPLKFYTVMYDETANFLTSRGKMETVMPNITEAFVIGLDPFTNYTVQVKVKNSVADKESEAVTVVTQAAGNCLILLLLFP